jgi:hypothetical protein
LADNMTQTRASKETLEKLVSHCTEIQHDWLYNLLTKCRPDSDFSIYQHVTGLHAANIAGDLIVSDMTPGKEKQVAVYSRFFLDRKEEDEQEDSEEDSAVRISIPIPSGRGKDKEYLDELLYGFIEQKVIESVPRTLPDGKPASNPDVNDNMHLTEEGYAAYKGFIDTSVERLAEKITTLLPDIQKGGLLRVTAGNDDTGLTDIVVREALFDPARASYVRSILPNVEINEESGDKFEDAAARRYALMMMEGLMRESGNDPQADLYFQESHIIGDDGQRVPCPAFTPEGRERLVGMGKLYDKFTDAITDAMLELERKHGSGTQYPFHIKIKVPEPELIETQGVEAEAKLIFLDCTKEYRLPEFVIPAIEDRKLLNGSIDYTSTAIVEQAIYRIIAPQMDEKVYTIDTEDGRQIVREPAHPLFNTCFMKEEGTDNHYLTEKGAELLCDVIKDLSGALAEFSLEMRKMVPEHLSGIKMKVRYRLNPDDTMAYLAPYAREEQEGEE